MSTWVEAKRMVIWRVFNIGKKNQCFLILNILYSPLNIKPKIVKYCYVVNLVAFTPRLVRKPGNSHIHAEDRSS